MPKASSKRPKRPSDPMQLAKLIGDQATGQTETPPAPTADEISRVMAALGRIGGQKGGPARANALSKKQRREIASRAAKARWKGKS